MNKTIHLISKNKSLIISGGSQPEIIHWGNRLPQLSTSLAEAVARPVTQARLDIDVPLGLCPGLGEGLFSAPALEGHRTGLDWAPIFNFKLAQSDHSQALFVGIDKTAQLELSITIELDPSSDVLRTRLSLRNLATENYLLTKLTPTLPLPYRATELMTFHGRWCQEFQTQRAPWTQGSFIQESRRGRTSHENFPGLMAGCQGFSEQQGEVWGFHLGWSGNHQFRAEVKSDGRRFVQAGELLLPGEVELACQQTYTTPWLYCSHSSAGLNGVSAAFHRYVREQILQLDPNKARPVHLNTWEGIYFEHQPHYIQQMATEAAQLGVERFIIDDGWFVGRHGERVALGDWYLDKEKYPNGLEPVIEHINQLGLEFGLWLEPEMVSKDSMLYRQHPDWLLELPGYQQPSGRWQYVLNLQNSACFNYLYERIDALVTRYNIAYLKWDMNRELVQPAHQGRAAVRGQTQALYRLIDQLKAQHPQLEIESCSSGGGRIDFEILRRTQRFWPSDCNDALERQTIQRGMSYFFPPEVMGSHIGPHTSHTTRRQQSMNLRGLTALSGHMGLELDPVAASSEDKQAASDYIRLHKQFRYLLHSGCHFRLDCSEPTRQAYGIYNEHEMLVTLCQLTMPRYSLMEPLRLAYLAPNKRYRVKLITAPESKNWLMKRPPAWLDTAGRTLSGAGRNLSGAELILSGAELGQIGLTLPVLDPESALLIHLQCIDEQ